MLSIFEQIMNSSYAIFMVIFIQFLFISSNSLVHAQSFLERPDSEIWYMGMDEPEKPLLFMKSVGVGDTVLVLHGGFGAEHSYLLNLIEALVDDFHFVLFDQRGSLRSPAADSLLTFQHLIEDIEWIRQELKVKKLILLGHSMGTRLAMGYADSFPSHVKNLVLVSAVEPALRIPEWVTDMSQLPPTKYDLASKHLRNRPEVEKVLRVNSLLLNDENEDYDMMSYKQRSDLWRIKHAGANIFDVTKWRQITGGLTLFNARSMRLLGGSAPEPFDYTNSLREADVPITVIAGDHDFGNFDALSYQELYREIIDSTVMEIPEDIFPTWKDYKTELPRLEVYSIENAGHNPWIDQPGEVKKRLLQALSRE